jgi:hypothetical protein
MIDRLGCKERRKGDFMIKLCNVIFFIAAVSISFGSLSADSSAYPAMNQAELTGYYNQLEQAINKAEKAVEQAKYEATRKDIIPSSVNTIALQNAIVQLDVKKTLVNNFKGTESLQSPLVRRELLAVLNKSLIMPSDLANLQGLVLEEKAKIRAAEAQAQTQSQSQTAPSTSIPTEGTTGQ